RRHPSVGPRLLPPVCSHSTVRKSGGLDPYATFHVPGKRQTSTKSHRKEPEAAAPEAAEPACILATEAKKPFEVLGLAPANASYAVRSAFRRLSLLVHLDKNPET
ncbi:unnamed protein product, partial [Symbiodinium sp. KB8]